MSETISIAYLNETSPAIVTFRVFVSVIDSMTVIIVREYKNNNKNCPISSFLFTRSFESCTFSLFIGYLIMSMLLMGTFYPMHFFQCKVVYYHSMVKQ